MSVSRDPHRHARIYAAREPARSSESSPDCFADEIVIDFPSMERLVERAREAFLGEPEPTETLQAEVSLSRREAFRGAVVPVDVPFRCLACCGTGHALVCHPVKVLVPPGVTHGDRFRYRVSAPHSAAVRVEVRVAIRISAT
ncbi:MAG: hypothetical protein DMF89_18550 [Acidobacteria bacterium]|nr:MAG: hypothetical protein DMF89_18550 [Acidobacteriota bacterium]